MSRFAPQAGGYEEPLKIDNCRYRGYGQQLRAGYLPIY